MDSFFAPRDPSGVLRKQLEANGALADGNLDLVESQQLLFSVLEAQGIPVSLDVMPGSTHTSLSDEGWKVFLAAFGKAVAQDLTLRPCGRPPAVCGLRYSRGMGVIWEQSAAVVLVLANRTIIGAFAARRIVLRTVDPTPHRPRRLPKHVRYHCATPRPISCSRNACA